MGGVRPCRPPSRRRPLPEPPELHEQVAVQAQPRGVASRRRAAHQRPLQPGHLALAGAGGAKTACGRGGRSAGWLPCSRLRRSAESSWLPNAVGGHAGRGAEHAAQPSCAPRRTSSLPGRRSMSRVRHVRPSTLSPKNSSRSKLCRAGAAAGTKSSGALWLFPLHTKVSAPRGALAALAAAAPAAVCRAAATPAHLLSALLWRQRRLVREGGAVQAQVPHARQRQLLHPPSRQVGQRGRRPACTRGWRGL